MTVRYPAAAAILAVIAIFQGVAVAASTLVPVPGSTFRDCPTCPELVVIPKGRFRMGSPDDEPRRQPQEGPAHDAAISHAFALGKYEVTWDEWAVCVADRVCPAGNDEGFGRGRKPVINVSWDEARNYARWLSRKTGQHYRLPTETEWEYAARAGTTRARYWGDADADACRYANVFNAAFMPYKGMKWTWEAFNCNDGSEETEPVGQRLPNAFGLHDMLGNVREWTASCYDNTSYPGPEKTDADCTYRVTRGGSWVTEPVYVRAAARYWVTPNKPNDDLGFRLLRELP